MEPSAIDSERDDGGMSPSRSNSIVLQKTVSSPLVINFIERGLVDEDESDEDSETATIVSSGTTIELGK